jgi:hypothetical protein
MRSPDFSPQSAPPVQWERRQLDPTFDPLRGDPRFEKLADSDGK